MRRRMARRVSLVIAALAVAVTLAGCSDGGHYTPAGPFRPLPQGAPPQVGPPTPQAPAPAPGQPADPGSGQQQSGDPNVVATGLDVPTGLVMLPDGSAIVGERRSGRLLQVFPDHSPPRPLMTIPGIDPSGDGGLLALALSPTYTEDGLLYAYISTPTDNRVVRFPLGGTPNPVLTGVPHGPTHNGGALLFDADGSLFVGTGDTGNPALAQDPNSLGGKILHVDVFGHPIGAGPVYSQGLSNVTALCFAGRQELFATDDPGTGRDEVDLAAQGADYGWPTPTAQSRGPAVDFPAAESGPGGCAAAAQTLFVGELDGRRLQVITLGPSGAANGKPEDFLENRYGRLRTVVLAPDGALWITTSNRDGVGTPRPDDDKVLRIVPPASNGSSPL